MRKHQHLLLVLGGMLIVLLGAAGLSAEPAADPTLIELLQAESASPAEDPADDLFAPAATPAGCTFCNPSGYLVCQNADGTACGVPGQFRRCIVAPVCYCEWGGCSCQNGVWNCFW